MGGGEPSIQCGPFCKDCDPVYGEYGDEPIEEPQTCGPPIVGWSSTCDCVSETAENYDARHYENYFPIGGSNSNTFAQIAIDGCGLDCDLPPSAVGADHTYLPSIALRGCTARAQIGLGTGVTVGLTQVTAEVAGLPVGISSEGIHCLITIEWPWNW